MKDVISEVINTAGFALLAYVWFGFGGLWAIPALFCAFLAYLGLGNIDAALNAWDDQRIKR